MGNQWHLLEVVECLIGGAISVAFVEFKEQFYLEIQGFHLRHCYFQNLYLIKPKNSLHSAEHYQVHIECCLETE